MKRVTLETAFGAIAAVLILAAGVTPTPVRAAVEKGTDDVELTLGWYMPGPEFDRGGSIGARFNHNVNRRFGIAFEVDYWKGDARNDDASLRQVFLDLVADFNLLPASRTSLSVFGGLGFAFVKLDGGSAVGGFNSDTFTLNLGIAAKLEITPKFYIRPGVRTRWLEQREADEYDNEAFLGLGYRW